MGILKFLKIRILCIRPAKINCMFYLKNFQEVYARTRKNIHKPLKIHKLYYLHSANLNYKKVKEMKIVYFSVCVFFLEFLAKCSRDFILAGLTAQYQCTLKYLQEVMKVCLQMFRLDSTSVILKSTRRKG